MKKTTSLTLVFGASLAAALAACGSDTKPQTTTPVTSSTEPVEPAEPTPPVAETTPPAQPAEPPRPAEPPKPTYLHGKFVWFELVSKDPEKSKAFWTELVGWTAEPQEMQGQKFDLIKAGDKEVAIIQAAENKKVKSHWVPFISVPDVDQAVAAIEQNKGKVVKPAADIPDIGRFAIVTDPNGAHFAVFKSAKGDQPDGQPKAGEFVWVENLVKNKKAHQTAVSFYPTVIGYTTNAVEMGTGKKKETYDMLNYGEMPRAGIDEPKPRSLAGQWLPWVAVDDVDATVAKVKELSKKKLRGKVITKPHDIPNVGRAAVVADPAGAVLGLLQPLSPEQQKAAAEQAAAKSAADGAKAPEASKAAEKAPAGAPKK